MAQLVPNLKFREVDTNGDPLVGGLLYSYVAGTTTLFATFTDQTETTSNANPTVLDANGEADVWIGTGNYKFILTDANGVERLSQDNVRLPTSGTPGSSFRLGLGVPSDALGLNGDTYLNLLTGDGYTKSAGVYSLTGTLDLGNISFIYDAINNRSDMTATQTNSALRLFADGTGYIRIGFQNTPVGINKLPSADAILDVESTDHSRGSRPAPKMTQAQRDAISSPGEALQVYNTDSKKYNYHNGTSWAEIGSGGSGTGFVETNFTFTNSQAAANLSGETINSASYTSAEYYFEVLRGTTIFASGKFILQYLNSAWRIVEGEYLGEPHGLTFSLSGNTTAQLKLASDGSGSGSIKFKKLLYAV